MRRFFSGRAGRIRLAALVVVIAVPLGALAFVLAHKPGNVSHPNISFTVPTVTVTPPPPPPDTFAWPFFGYEATRTRDFTGEPGLRPPLRVAWRFGGNALIELPPVIYQHTLYFIDDGATAKAVSVDTGRQLWATHVGKLSAASPALDVGAGLLFVPTLSQSANTPGGGELAALSMRTGRIVWTHPVPSGSESSPLVANGRVYFGDQAGHVYALDARSGHVDWIYQAAGAVKGGPSLSGGLLYFGDYSGHAYALNAATGHVAWDVGTSGTQFGFGSGNFYSTPAIAFGRVYMGNTDGFMYSFAARTGQLAWSTGTGSYVYASPAVADVPGLGPTVFAGSYSGYFYAFNAQSGRIRWSHPAGGRISGSATVVNGVVYFSDLGVRTTIGLDVRTGRQVFAFHDGAFTPVVALPNMIILSGYDTLYGLVPAG